LGKTLFKRSQLERDDPKIEVQTLLQAIEVLEKVLAIEPEDLDAHQWLKQCYSNLGRDAPVAKESADAKDIGAASLQAQANTIADQHRTRDEHLQAALNLKLALEIFGQRPLLIQEQPPVLAPKLPVIRNLQIQLRSVSHKEAVAEVRVALAA